MPKLRRQTIETAIIERYQRRESSVEEALMEMYLAGVSVRRVEDITEALWGTRVSTKTVSNLNKKIYAKIEEWRHKPIDGEPPYLFLDGIIMAGKAGPGNPGVEVIPAVGRQPSCFPRDLAAARPERMHSPISSRSNSAIPERIVAIMRPCAVEKSKRSPCMPISDIRQPSRSRPLPRLPGRRVPAEDQLLPRTLRRLRHGRSSPAKPLFPAAGPNTEEPKFRFDQRLSQCVRC